MEDKTSFLILPGRNAHYWSPKDRAVTKLSTDSDRAYFICNRYTNLTGSSLGIRAKKNS